MHIFLNHDSLPYLKKILSEMRENFNEELCAEDKILEVSC